MSNNTTLSYSPTAYVNYIAQGSVIFVSNGLILTAILKHSVLRMSKEYFILAALALADFLHACGLIIGGCYRTWLIYKGTATTLVNSWDCLTTAHNMIWIWTPQAQDYMLLGVTLDRLLMTLVPLEYIGWGHGYVYTLLGSIFAAVSVVGVGGIVASYNEPRTPTYDAICFTSWAIGSPYYNTVRDTLQAIALFASVGLYPFIPLVYIFRSNKVKDRVTPAASEINEKMRRQKRLMVTVGMCVMTTLVFDAVPKLSRVWMHTSELGKKMHNMLVPFGVFMHNCNSFANLFFYTFRHSDIRTGILYLLKCKELPPNFETTHHK